MHRVKTATTSSHPANYLPTTASSDSPSLAHPPPSASSPAPLSPSSLWPDGAASPPRYDETPPRGGGGGREVGGREGGWGRREGGREEERDGGEGGSEREDSEFTSTVATVLALTICRYCCTLINHRENVQDSIYVVVSTLR